MSQFGEPLKGLKEDLEGTKPTKAEVEKAKKHEEKAEEKRSQPMSAHTPTPWIAREQKSRDGKSLGWIIEFDGGRIGWSSYATTEPNEGESSPYPIGAANAAFIAEAVNSHAALKARIEELEGALRRIEALGRSARADGSPACQMGNIAHAELIAGRSAVPSAQRGEG